MTICIATICDDFKKIVVASDRMITGSYPPIEFEHESSKINKLTNSCVMLTAGDALICEELLQEAKLKIGKEDSNLSISQIKDVIQNEYEKLRKREIENRYLRPRGIITLEDFYEKHINKLPSPLAPALDNEIANFKFELIILIAGVDEKGAHLFTIHNPGISNYHNRLGYCSIGIGDLHASISLIASNHNPHVKLIHGIFNTYKAKKAAEVAPGVGKITDMAVIDDKEIKFLPKNDIEKLEEIYQKINQPQNLDDLLKKLTILIQYESEGSK